WGRGCRSGLGPPDDEVAEGVDGAAEPGRDEGGCVVLLDDGRAVQVLAGEEVGAMVHGGVLPLVVMVDRPAADGPRGPGPGWQPPQVWLRQDARDGGAEVDQLDVGRPVGVGVEALVKLV